MKKILCPVDFSDTSINAVNYAGHLSRDLNAALSLYHVESLWALEPVELVRGHAMQHAMVSDQLEQLAQDVSRRYKISCYSDTEISGASLPSILVNKASGYNLLVMGSEGEGDLLKRVTGSNTYQVATHSNVPVIAVPSSAGYQQVTDIVYAADYIRNHHVAMTQLIVLAKSLQARLHLVQVVTSGCSVAERHELIEFQRSLCQMYEDDVKISTEVLQSDHIAEMIHHRMARPQADMLAVSARHHGLVDRLMHENVIRELTTIAKYPVFIFHQ